MTSPATTPDVIVAVRGVLLCGLILDKHLKSSPSSAMAQITLGIGNMEPSRLGWEREKNRKTRFEGLHHLKCCLLQH